jgi:HSP20 family protein
MALVRWEPFEGLMSLRREMDRLFERFFEPGPLTTERASIFEPAVEVADCDGHVMVKAQVPGVSKDNIQLDITEDTLTLRGEMKAEEKIDEKQFYRREFRYGAFSRTIPLPSGVQADKATAELKDGMLTVTLPKSERAKAKQIPIKT